MHFPQGHYGPEQLAVLQSTFENVCKDLNINEAETKRRECVAEVIMTLVHVGQYNSERLKTHAISRLQRLDGHES